MARGIGMRYSDGVTCKACDKPMRGKGLDHDEQGREFIACEYCSARHAVIRVQIRPGGRIQVRATELLDADLPAPLHDVHSNEAEPPSSIA